MGQTFKLAETGNPKIGPHQLVVNLSKSFVLSSEQNSVLLKGLSFIPSSRGLKTQRIELLKSLQSYHRRLKLETYFEGKRKHKKKLPFTHGSDWTPTLSKLPKQISQIIKADWYAFKKLDWGRPVGPNLTAGEIKAITQLQNNKKIVIKPADKGNAVVILDRDQYVWEARRQLDVKQHYCPLDGPMYPQTFETVRKILKEMCEKNVIKEKQLEYLLGSGTPRARRFYLLPKIHKEPKDWSLPFNIPPGRPIVSDCNSETYCTAEYIEHFLNPISRLHPTYLKDTHDFIDKIGKLKIPTEAFLFTIDIDSLYTNIETKAGLRAVRDCMKKYPDPKRPDEYILKLLEINLTKNDFEFDSKFYLQVKGTAMGKKFAPSYANIFMAAWEESALSSFDLKPFAFYRFLDDIWGVWTHSRDSFSDFVAHLNQHQSSITIKHSIDPVEINFLDVVSYKGPKFEETGKLDFKVYFKETDTHSLLHKYSHHPKHTFKGIIKSQLLRFHRICSEKHNFHIATKILFTALRKRGYSRSFLRGIQKSFLKPKETSGTEDTPRNKIIPCIAKFSHLSIQLNRALKENFKKFLEPTQYLKRHRPMAAYQRNNNLLDRLVQSKLPTVTTTKKRKRRRKKKTTTKKQVEPHNYFSPRRWVCNAFTKQVFDVQQPLSPRTCNCVYLIYCLKCHKKYVGQTKNALRIRIGTHKCNIIRKNKSRRYVVEHFLAHGIESFRVTGLQSRPWWTLQDRLKAERLWINRLETRYPRGLNEN